MEKKLYTYTYSQEQVDELYRYLMTKPMMESEKFVNILRKPVSLNDVTSEQQQNEAQKEG